MAAVFACCQTRVMTDAPRTQTPHQPPKPDQITRFFDWIRGSGLNRDGDRWFAGVCGGIAARTGLDPLIVRGIAVVIAVLGGPVVVAYAVGWALLPRGAGRIYTEEAVRGRFQPAMVVIGALLLATVVPMFRGLGWNGPTGFWAAPDWLAGLFSLGWGLAVTAGIVWLIVYLIRRARRQGNSGSGFGPFAPPSSPSSPFGPGSVYDPRPSHGTGNSPQADAPAASEKPAPSTAAFSSAEPSTEVDASMAPTRAFGAPQVSTQNPIVIGAVGETYPPANPYAPDSVRNIRSDQNRAWQEQNRARQAAHRARVRARRPGAGYSAIVLGLALATGAVAAGVNSSGVWSRDAILLGVAFALGVLALGIVIAGIRGRTDGAMGGFAVLAVISLVVLGVFPQGTQFSAVGDNVWTLSAQNGDVNPATSYAMIAGKTTLALSDFDNPGLDDDRVFDVWLGAGVTNIRLPADAPVRVEAHTLVGGVEYSGRAVAAENGERTGVFASDQRTFNASSRGDGPLLRIWTLAGIITLDSSNN